MLHTQLAALALAATTLAASGCGGSSKTTSTTTAANTSAPATTAAAPTTSTASVENKSTSGKPLTQAELIAKADAICARVNAKRSTIAISTAQQYATLVPQLASYEQAAVAELAALVPPASMANDWNLIVAGSRQLADNTTKLGEDAKAEDFSSLHTLVASNEKTQAQLTATAKRAGFKDCAQSS